VSTTGLQPHLPQHPSRKIHGESEQTIRLNYLDLANKAIAALTDWEIGSQIAWRKDIQEVFDTIPARLQRVFSAAMSASNC
jgi:hypothetical protein